MADERLDSEEIADLAGLPSKTKIRKKVVRLGKGQTFEIRTTVRQVITPEGEIVEESETETKMLSCGHQTSDPNVVKLCGYNDCIVCQECIVFCERIDCPNNCHSKGLCKNCAIEYTDDKEKFYLCPDCANYFELAKKRDVTFKSFKRLIGIKQKEKQ